MRALALIAIAPLVAFVALQEEDFEDGYELLDEEQTEQPSPARVAVAMALRTPGEDHRRLAQMAGTWSAEMRIWPTPSVTKPIVMYGSLEAHMVLGGRFLRLEGRFGEGEHATERLAMLGFDRRWEEYTRVEFDNQGTYAVRARGEYDAGSESISLVGEDRDPVLEVTQRYNVVYELVDEDTMVHSVVFLDESHGNSGPFKLVETTLRRQ